MSRFRDGRFTTYSTAQGLSSKAVQAIAQDAEGSLWIGTRSGGLHRLRDGRLTVYSTRPGLPFDSVSALLGSRDGGLWIGARGGGLSRLKGGSFTTWTTRDGLPNDTIHFLLESRDGSLVDRDQRGRTRALPRRPLRAVHGSGWPRFGDRQRDPRGCPGNAVGGDIRGRPEPEACRRAFTAYTTAEGLYDDAIFGLLEDAQGRFWMSCNKGIFRVDKRELDDLDQKKTRGSTPWPTVSRTA